VGAGPIGQLDCCRLEAWSHGGTRHRGVRRERPPTPPPCSLPCLRASVVISSVTPWRPARTRRRITLQSQSSKAEGPVSDRCRGSDGDGGGGLVGRSAADRGARRCTTARAWLRSADHRRPVEAGSFGYGDGDGGGGRGLGRRSADHTRLDLRGLRGRKGLQLPLMPSHTRPRWSTRRTVGGRGRPSTLAIDAERVDGPEALAIATLAPLQALER